VHNTFHVSNIKKCHADEPLAVLLDGLHFDDKLHFVKEPVEIVDHEVKRLKLLVTKPHNKTPYELLLGRTPNIGFMRPFGCPVTTLNTLDHLGKFDGKADEGFLVVYYNTNDDATFEVKDPEFKFKEPESAVHVSPRSSTKSKKHDDKTKREAKGKTPVDTPVSAVRQISTHSTNTFSAAGPSNNVVSPTLGKSSYVDPFQYLDDLNMPVLEDITYYDDEEDVEGRYRHIQEEGIDYEEVFAPVARIEAVRLFLAYASFMGFMVYQMDVKSAFLYGTIKEEVYVYQPPRFEDPDYPDNIYKVVKALYGLHQALKAWFETLANYLLENGFQRGKIDQTLFIKKQKGNILLVQVYVDDIMSRLFCSTNKDLYKAFEKLMKDMFQMSSIGELTFFLGLQVNQKQDGIFISQDKYVAEILRKFGLTDGKSASTPIDTERPLLKDPDGEDVDVHTYRSMIGSLMYLTSSRPDIMFVVCYQVDAKDGIEVSAVDLKLLLSPNASEGFEQILDFLNASVIQYALTVNLTIYVSCIKQFWSSVSVKKVNDVVRLQALIDRRKVIITEDTVHQALHLDDAKSIDCLPNEEIFAKLARMGLVRNVDSSLKFYMYPRFLQLMIAAQVGDLSSHTTKYSSPVLIQKVFANMRRVGKGFFGVDTPLFEGMLVPQQAADDVANVATDDAVDDVANVAADDVADDVNDVVAEVAAESTPPSPPPPVQELPSTSQVVPTLPPSPIAQPSSPPPQHQSSQPLHDAAISMDLLNTLLETYTTITRKVKALEQDKIAQALEITKLKQRVKRLEKKHKLKVSGGCIQIGRIIAKIDADEDVILEEADAEEDTEVADKDATIQGRLKESQAQVYHIDLEHADKVLSMQDNKQEPAELKEVIEVVTTAKLITEVVTAAADPITAATITTIPKQGKRKEKEDNAVLRYQSLKKKPQTEAQARKNMIVYLKNMAGFKKDFFKGMSYDDIRPIFEKHFNSVVGFLEKSEKQLEEEASRALKKKSENSEQQAVKKQKFDKEVEELKKHLQIVLNDEDDVYTEATPLPLKMLNDVRLKVEEESEVSLELLRFVRRHFGVDDVEDFKEYNLRDYYCWLKTYCYWYKLKLLDNAADSRLSLLEQSAAADDKMKK
nr:putative ribonuclease H-like domain-containing protein [Tanacetum cinerariifolium]